MLEKTGFRLDAKEKGPDQWTKRAAKAGGKLAVAEARRVEAEKSAELVRQEKLAKLDGIFSIPSTDKYAELWQNNLEELQKLNTDPASGVEKAHKKDYPIVVSDSPDGSSRDPVKVAFGGMENDETRNLVVLSGNDLTTDKVRAIQDVYEDGVTVVAPVETVSASMDFLVDDPSAGKQSVLRPSDAVVGFYGMQQPDIQKQNTADQDHLVAA